MVAHVACSYGVFGVKLRARARWLRDNVADAKLNILATPKRVRQRAAALYKQQLPFCQVLSDVAVVVVGAFFCVATL